VSRYNALYPASARLEKLPNRLGITIRPDCDKHGTPQYYPRAEASCLINRVNTVSGFIRIAVFISSSTLGYYGEFRCGPPTELAIFRIVQESLTNIHRHSGSKMATIHLSRTACNVLLEIQDQGKGIPAEKLAAIKAQRTGVGIAGMRERVRHFKAELDMQSKATGATIVVTFPLATAVASGSEAILQPS
jgi:signal transduction histidine kinase